MGNRVGGLSVNYQRGLSLTNLFSELQLGARVDELSKMN